MITVHHLERSRSHRILWALEELGVEYEIVVYQRDPKTLLAPPALRAIHPLGKSPVITEDGRTLAESGAILEFLAARHGKLAPAAGTDDHLRYSYWMHYAEGSLTPMLLLSLVASRIRTAPVPFFVKPVVRGVADKLMKGYVSIELVKHLDFVEAELGTSAWFAGADLSMADIQMSYPIEAAEKRAGLDASRPNLWRWLEKIRQRPAYLRALERGGPLDLAK
jgi:glutathione S-transferase